MVDFVGFVAFFNENCSIFQKNGGASYHSTGSDLPVITRYVEFLPPGRQTSKHTPRTSSGQQEHHTASHSHDVTE